MPVKPPKEATVRRKRVLKSEAAKSKGERLYLMLDLQVPAPFVKGQKKALRDCTRTDLENALKVARATDAAEPMVKFLSYLCSKFARVGPKTIPEGASLAALELALKDYEGVYGSPTL